MSLRSASSLSFKKQLNNLGCLIVSVKNSGLDCCCDCLFLLVFSDRKELISVGIKSFIHSLMNSLTGIHN